MRIKPLFSIIILIVFITLSCFSIENKGKRNTENQEITEEIIINEKINNEGANFTKAPIILPKESSPFMKDAANELANYIEKICGIKPQVMEGPPSPIPSKAIWVGYQPAVNKLFPSIKFNYDYPEEIINAANENYIVISGRDKWDPKNMTIPDRTGKKMITGVQQEYGTCNAVYTFIQDQLNVRWLWPGPLGEDIIKASEIKIPTFFYRYHPQIRDRSGILYLTRLISNKVSKEEHRWARLQRMQLSSLVMLTSHGFLNWWEKYGKTNPDFFALLPDGKRQPKDNPQDVKLCQSNPKVWDQWMNEVEVQIKANPTLTVFFAGQNDGWNQGHCTCKNCLAWDGTGFTWSNPNLSDREVTFANKLAEKLKAKYPDKGYFIAISGYGYTRPAPVKSLPADNVLILSVSNFLQRGDGDERTLAMKQYSDWAKITRNLGWRPNIGNPAGLTFGMPDIAPHQASKDFKFIAQNGCLGLFFDTYWNHWSTQCIQYYALAQLAWNPALQIDSLLDDYYLRAYGPAANEMKAYWKLMEDTRNDFIAKFKTKWRFAVATDFYTGGWFDHSENLLKKAIEKVGKGESKYLERVNFTAGGLSFCKLLVDTRKKVELFENDPGNEKIKKEIDANWAKANAMKSILPKFSINFGNVFKNTKSMEGLHYDAPLGKKAKKSLEAAQGFE